MRSDASMRTIEDDVAAAERATRGVSTGSTDEMGADHESSRGGGLAIERRLEEKYRSETPELVWTVSLADFGALAALALAPRELPTVGLEHLHAPLVSIREQAAIVVALLQANQSLTFRELIVDCAEKGLIIARFLAVLELYRHGALSFDQAEPLGELSLHWDADGWLDDNLANLGADYEV